MIGLRSALGVTVRWAGSMLLLLSLACGDPSESATPLEVATPAPALIAVTGDAGVVHFEPNTMIVSDQEGRRIQLENETQTSGLNIVDVIAVTDQNIQTFQSSPFPDPPPECNGATGENCATVLGESASPSANGRRRIEDAFRGRMRLRFDRTRKHPSRGAAPGVAAAAATVMPSAGVMKLASWTSEAPCYDIAVAIYEATQHYNALKSSWIYYLKNKLVGSASGTAQSGSLPTPSGTISGMEVEMAIWNQDFMVTRSALDLLAWQYKSYGCWNNTWADRSSWAFDGYSPGGSGRWGFYMKDCEPVWVEIDLGEGIWYEGWGEICEYKFFPYGALRVDPTTRQPGITPEVRPQHRIVRRSDVQV